MRKNALLYLQKSIILEYDVLKSSFDEEYKDALKNQF